MITPEELKQLKELASRPYHLTSVWENINFAMLARTAVPKLIEEVERLREFRELVLTAYERSHDRDVVFDWCPKLKMDCNEYDEFQKSVEAHEQARATNQQKGGGE